MAKIPLYQQGQLASSVVGTPGINEAPMMAAQEIGQEAGQVGQADLSMLNQSRGMADRNIEANRTQEDINREHVHAMFSAVANEVQQRSIDNEREMYAAQQEVINARKAAVKMQRDSQISTSSTDIGMKLDSLSRTMRESRMNNPTGTADDYVDQAKALLDQHLNSQPFTPEVRAGIQKSGLARIAQEQSKLNDWEVKAGADKAADDIALNEAQASQTVRDGKGDFEAYNSAKEAIINQKGAYYNRYGQAEGKVRMQKALSAVADDYLSSIVDTDGDKAVSLLGGHQNKDGTFSYDPAHNVFAGTMDDRKLNSFRNQAEKTVDSNIVKAFRTARAQALSESTTTAAVWAKYPDNQNNPAALGQMYNELERRKEDILKLPEQDQMAHLKELDALISHQKEINYRQQAIENASRRTQGAQEAQQKAQEKEQAKQDRAAVSGMNKLYAQVEKDYQSSPEKAAFNTRFATAFAGLNTTYQSVKGKNVLTDKQLDPLEQIYEARDVLYEGMKNRMLTPEQMKYGVSKIQTFIDRHKNDVSEYDKTIEEHIADHVLRDASGMVHQAHNPFNDPLVSDSIKAKYARMMAAEITQAQKEGYVITPSGLEGLYAAVNKKMAQAHTLEDK